MSFISKILDAFKMESTREMGNAADRFVPEAQTVKDLENETNNTKYNHNDYYARIAKQKENNLKITYDDVKCYNLRPFDLNKSFISDGHFTAIELEGDNLEKAYKYLQAVHDILMPFKHLFENAVFPNKIGTDYWIWNPENNLPISHLRLTPFTATMKNNKYPFWLWLSHCNDCGAEYIYMIYFNQQGEIGKCDLSLHGSNGARLSYESKIRRNENGLYVMRINKTLYVEPYGTKIIYHYQDDKDFKTTQSLSLNGIKKKEQGEFKEKQSDKRKQVPRKKHMSQYDINQFARECNAYMIREERRERQEQEEKAREENKIEEE